MARNTAFNALGTGLPLLLGLWAVPVLIHGLGPESFGILTLIWAGIGYFSFLDLGLGRALTQALASCRAESNETKLKTQLYWGLILALALGIVGAVVAAPGLYWYAQQSERLEPYRWAFVCAAMFLPLVTLNSALRGALEGMEEFADSNANKVSLGLLNFAFPVLVLVLEWGNMEVIVLSLGLARLVAVGMGLYSLGRLGVFPQRMAYEPLAVKPLLQFGGWLTLSNLISPLMSYADRFLLGIGAVGTLAYYTVPQDFALRLLVIPVALMGVLFPRMAFEKENAKHTYRKGFNVLVVFMGILTTLLILGANELFSIWLGSGFAKASSSMARVLLVGLFFNACAHLPLASLHAQGQVKATSLLHAVECVIYVPMMFWAYSQFGAMGLAWAWTTRAVVDAMALFYMQKIRVQSLWQ